MLFTECSSSYKFNDLSAQAGNTSRNFMFDRINTDKQELDDMLLCEDNDQASDDIARCRSLFSKQFKMDSNNSS